ncbi:hypothetical protein, partial [Serratia marcescens]|uniref:hypothetical protein n=1 Tax=Serratia marcescens TaxID=615 RepID=UPI003F6723C4
CGKSSIALAMGSGYRLFGAPYTGYLVLAFLVAVLGIMAYDEDSRPTVYALGVIVPLLVLINLE